MIRGRIWFRCAGAFNPVTPVIIKPAIIGWKTPQGRDPMNFAIERAFNGEELLRRMKGWVTADVRLVITIVNRHGRLKILDEQDLFVETETEEDFEHLKRDLLDGLREHVALERL